MKSLEIIEKLQNSYDSIKNEAKTGGDLYNSFTEYRDFVVDNWPKEMSDQGNWVNEMESVLSLIEKKRKNKSITQSQEVSSFKNDALEVMHAINVKFITHLNK